MPSRRLVLLLVCVAVFSFTGLFLASSPEATVQVRMEVEERVERLRKVLHNFQGSDENLDEDLAKHPITNTALQGSSDDYHAPSEKNQNSGASDLDDPAEYAEHPKIKDVSEDSENANLEDSFDSAPLVCPDALRGEVTPDISQASTKFDDCIPVPVVPGSLFTISICHAQNTCNAGFVRVERIDKQECRRMESVPRQTISSDLAEAKFVAKTLGPDAFEVQLDGPERKVFAIPQYEGNCSYKYPFSLNNGGRIILRVYWMFTQYHHYSVTLPAKWPNLIDQDLLTSPFVVPESFCSTACPRRNVQDDFDMSLLAPCSRIQPIHGIYLPDRPLSYYRVPHGIQDVPKPGSKSNKISKRAYRPPVDTGYQWKPICRPDSKILDLDDRATRRSCLRGPKRRILFLGDSHCRFLYDALLPRLAGGGTPSWAKALHKTRTFGNTKVDFTWDPYLQDLIDGKINITNYDTVLLSVGAHTLFHHMLLSSWHGHIRTILRSLYSISGKPVPILSDKKQTKTKFVFMATPSHPPRDDAFSRDQADWRTNMHLSSWSSYSRQQFLEAGYPVIDSFTLTMPFVRDTIDRGHYRLTPAEDAMLQEAVLKLGICPTEKEPKGYEWSPMENDFSQLEPPEEPLQLAFPKSYQETRKKKPNSSAR